MPGWDTLKSFGPADKTLNAEGVEALRQQLTKPQPLSSLFIPAFALLVNRSDVGAIASTTVPMSPTVVVPQNAAAATYYFEVDITSGTGSVYLRGYHAPGGGTISIALADTTGSVSGFATPLLDINAGRLTYSTSIGGSPTYSTVIYLTGFLRAGALI